MALEETDLPQRAKKFELKRSQKIRFSPSSITSVDELLHDVYVARSPRPDEYHHRRDLVRIFNLLAREIYGSSDGFPVVEVFGSFLMDMFSSKSDLDLSINFSNGADNFAREEKIAALRKFVNLFYTLQWKGHVFGVHPIMGAKVPIVKVVDRGTGIECDISVENKDGIAKSQIVHIISAIDERFQKLCFLIKSWANVHDINSPKDRTLSSLSLILLVALHLQTREPPILPPFSVLFKEGSDPENVGKAVHKFLYYGALFITLLIKLDSVRKLWAEGLCASTYEGSWITKKWGSRSGNLSVEDFTDRSQNVARAVGAEQVKKIYKCIKSSLDQMLAFMHGQIQAPKVTDLIFGSDYVRNEEVNNLVNVNLKRSFPTDDPAPSSPPYTAPTKKIRCTANSDPIIGTTQAHHECSNQVPPPHDLHQHHRWPPVSAPELGHGSVHPYFVPPQHFHGLQNNPFLFPGAYNLNPISAPELVYGAVHPSFVPPQHFHGPRQNPFLFPGTCNLNPVNPFLPYGGPGSAHSVSKENLPQGPFFNPYGYR
ncbi:hypothetical protein MKW98_019250 [Papaver atlanticum]|uniref:Poly(A) RNA polymerase mitochondrial-like central palm domain-containing protein n=1 Tax=Papaver atlanticum TaxID=357466 RepID=A0AAD4T923_9MAGN|nr:hypothetical protein MKW98_019250 [Papaver atlanticum]